MLAPDVHRLVLDLQDHWGLASACALVGCSSLAWLKWIDSSRKPSGAARRAIWCAWCLTFHPYLLAGYRDWLTWGRVRQRHVPAPGRYVEDYQI
jgi:hypothetical protein